MTQRRTFLGYHGTTKSVADAIASGDEEWLMGVSAGDWLGRGVYFWQDSLARARVWARNKWRGADDPLAVVCARIESEHCLDLIDIHDFALLKRAAASFESYERRTGVQTNQFPLFVRQGTVGVEKSSSAEPENDPMLNYRDHALVDWYVGMRKARFGEEIDTVRCAFINGRAVFGNSFLFDWAHIQIVSKNPAKIVVESVSDISA